MPESKLIIGMPAGSLANPNRGGNLIQLLEDAGFSSFPAYRAVKRPLDNEFRLLTGRIALHTHVSTQNNPYLNEIVPENVLWINTARASDMGIKTGDWLDVVSNQGEGRIRAFVTDLIHPEAVFMLHGFGHQASKATRSYNRGVSDSLLLENVSDQIGGSPALHETFVRVSLA